MVSNSPARRRLSVAERREELLGACLDLIGTQPWDRVTMADVATAAGASKPLVYHYFPTKNDLYVAAIRAAAHELRDATRPDPDLPMDQRLIAALEAHIDWIDANAVAYRAILQGGASSHPDVRDIIEESRANVIARLAEAFVPGGLGPARRIALRGWVGYLESACLDWLATRDISKAHLARLLAASVSGAIAASTVPAPSSDAATVTPPGTARSHEMEANR